jgi:hypothetical protein
MFSYKDLKNRFTNWESQPRNSLKIFTFEQDDFLSSSSEERIVIFLALKRDFSDPIDFYFEVLLNFVGNMENLQKSLEFEGLYPVISEEQFWTCVNQYISGLKNKFQFKFDGDWIDGMQLTMDWDSVFILAETDHEYCAFFWDTFA